jgi:hypothetical protein
MAARVYRTQALLQVRAARCADRNNIRTQIRDHPLPIRASVGNSKTVSSGDNCRFGASGHCRNIDPCAAQGKGVAFARIAGTEDKGA